MAVVNNSILDYLKANSVAVAPNPAIYQGQIQAQQNALRAQQQMAQPKAQPVVAPKPQVPAPKPVTQPPMTTLLQGQTAPGSPVTLPNTQQAAPNPATLNQAGGMNVDPRIGIGTNLNMSPIPTLGDLVAPRQDITSTLDPGLAEYMAQIQANQLAQQEQANAVMEQLAQAMSPDFFNQMLSQVMSSYQPLIEAQQAQVGKQVAEGKRTSDIDVERRGLYDSGVAAGLQRDWDEFGVQENARIMAEMQAQAVSQANQMRAQQLQGLGIMSNAALEQLGMTKDELKSYRQMTQDDKQFIANLTKDYDRMDTDAKTFLADLGFKRDMKQADREEFIADMNRLYWNADQEMKKFIEEMGFKAKQHDDNVALEKQRIGQMGADLQFRKDQAAIENARADRALTMQEGQYKANEKILAQEQYYRDMDTWDKGYTYVSGQIEQILGKKGTKESKIKELNYIKSSIKIYNTPEYSMLYKDLNNRIDETIKSLQKPPAPNINPKGESYKEILDGMKRDYGFWNLFNKN